MILKQTFRALRHRNFRLFTYGQIVSLIGTWMEQTAMGWLVYQLTNSTFLLGAVTAAGTAPMVIFSMWGGSLADRLSKRSILVATQVAAMLLAFVLAALVWFGHIEPWQIVVISLLNGVAMGFDMPARHSFVIEMTSREDLMNAISLNSSVFNGARLIGPAVAGVVLAWSSAAACFFINGLTFLGSIAALMMMRFPPHRPAAASASAHSHVMEGVRYVWNHTRVFTIMSLLAAVGIFGWSYSVLLPAYARDLLGVGANGYGALVSAAGFGALGGALTVAAIGHTFHPRTLALNGLWFFSVMLVLFAFSGNFHLSLAAQALTSFGMMLFFSTANTVMQQIVPDEMRGRVMGIWSLVFGAMIPIGSLQAGLLARWIGIRWTIALGAGVCAVAGIVTRMIARRREAEFARASEADSRPMP
jgi:MFS family permease